MSNTLKLGNGKWATGKDTLLSFSDTNNNYKPLPFSFSRASSGTVINKDGLIETVGSGEPRIDFKDNTKGALLLEPSRSNVLPYSNKFLNTGWQYYRGTITTNATISPDGTLNASRYQEDSQTGSHLFRRQSLSITNGLSYTGSIFAKKGELSSIILQSNSSSRWVASATFNLENGTVTSGTGVIENYGNGWYRCSISGNAVQTTPDAGFEIYTSVGTGRDGNGLFMYGAMFEQGSYATSYIPTSGQANAVTRIGDACNNGANEQVINSTEGVLYYEVSAQDNSITTSILSISNGSNANSLYSGFSSASNTIQAQLVVGGVAQTNMNYVVSDRTEFNKVAILYQNNNHKMYVNGVQASIDTSGSVPSPNTFDRLNFDLGQGSFDFYGNVKDVRVYNTALTDQELIALTS